MRRYSSLDAGCGRHFCCAVAVCWLLRGPVTVHRISRVTGSEGRQFVALLGQEKDDPHRGARDHEWNGASNERIAPLRRRKDAEPEWQHGAEMAKVRDEHAWAISARLYSQRTKQQCPPDALGAARPQDEGLVEGEQQVLVASALISIGHSRHARDSRD